MYHPTTRVLTALELLQARTAIGGAELAARLEVDVRTVRSYITMLRDLGIPIEARTGRHGGYRLRPGFRLPPLMLTNDEAVAVTLGLLFARRAGLAVAAPATAGALAKVERVLPEALRAQVRALSAALIIDSSAPATGGAVCAPLPATATLLALAAAAADARRVTLTYADRTGAVTTRPFDPYAVVYPANAAWYAIGHCHLRDGVRIFRLDRVAEVAPTGIPFPRPVGFDPLAWVRRALALLPAPHEVAIALAASRADAERWAAPFFATLTEEDGGVVLRCTATDLDWLARALVGLPFAFRILTPPALLEALGHLHARLGEAIVASHPARPC